MRALLSVSDKTGLLPLARRLASLGWELVSTGGTARAIAADGLPVMNVSDVTGFPEMLDGRVKTLHPAVHGGILARRHRPDDLAAISRQGIRPIDLVVVNLYPFAAAAARPDIAFDDLVEEIDIGGPSLLRASAKNFRDVLVVVNPEDYSRVIDAVAGGSVTLALRFALAQAAFAHTAAYDRMIAATLGDVTVGDEGAFVRHAPALLPARWTPAFDKREDLRYGENPHQQAAWYVLGGPAADRAGFGAATVHQGKALSFTNLLDLDAAVRIALEFDEPVAVVIKHTTP